MTQLTNIDLANLLKNDVKEFNKYRSEYPTQKIDLKNANLKGACLEWASLQGINLEGADLQGANLLWANLGGANLHGACIEGVNITLKKENIEAIKEAIL